MCPFALLASLTQGPKMCKWPLLQQSPLWEKRLPACTEAMWTTRWVDLGAFFSCEFRYLKCSPGWTYLCVQGVSTVSSLVSVLTQALHTDDSSLLEQCLSRSEPRIISETVRRLPARFVVPFLMSVVSRVYAKASRAAALIPWIKAIFQNHTSYLLTVPNLVKVCDLVLFADV